MYDESSVKEYVEQISINDIGISSNTKKNCYETLEIHKI